MVSSKKPRAIGFNHVALKVGDIEALAFYGRIFEFKLRGKSKTKAFIDLGDQLIALQSGCKQPADDGRHVGLVVDDKKVAGVKLIGGPFLDFRDPWGNRIQSSYTTIFSSPRLQTSMRGMGLTQLIENKSAKKELAENGMAVS